MPGISTRIAKQVKKRPPGETFRYSDLGIGREEFTAATKAVERLIRGGKLKRLKPGLFYRPRQTTFGEVLPSEEEILKTYLFSRGRRIAYITGPRLYNRMGLTRQIPAAITIAGNKRINRTGDQLKIRSVKSYVPVDDGNIFLLEILDALKDYITIPDLDIAGGLNILSDRVKTLSRTEMDRLTRYALRYPPRVRALLGAILDNMGEQTMTKELRQSLNPLSRYRFPVGPDLLPTVHEWNITL